MRHAAMWPITNFSTVYIFVLNRLAYTFGFKVDLKSKILLIHELMFQAGVKSLKGMSELQTAVTMATPFHFSNNVTHYRLSDLKLVLRQIMHSGWGLEETKSIKRRIKGQPRLTTLVA